MWTCDLPDHLYEKSMTIFLDPELYEWLTINVGFGDKTWWDINQLTEHLENCSSTEQCVVNSTSCKGDQEVWGWGFSFSDKLMFDHAVICFKERRAAILFKLVWGG